MSQCAFCRAPLAAGAQFCVACRKPIAQPSPPAPARGPDPSPASPYPPQPHAPPQPQMQAPAPRPHAPPQAQLQAPAPYPPPASPYPPGPRQPGFAQAPYPPQPAPYPPPAGAYPPPPRPGSNKSGPGIWIALGAVFVLAIPAGGAALYFATRDDNAPPVAEAASPTVTSVPEATTAGDPPAPDTRAFGAIDLEKLGEPSSGAFVPKATGPAIALNSWTHPTDRFVIGLPGDERAMEIEPNGAGITTNLDGIVVSLVVRTERLSPGEPPPDVAKVLRDMGGTNIRERTVTMDGEPVTAVSVDLREKSMWVRQEVVALTRHRRMFAVFIATPRVDFEKTASLREAIFASVRLNDFWAAMGAR